MNRPELPLSYLLECSKKSLQAFLLTQLNKSAERRKEVNRLLDEWVEAEALARLATWFETNGESLVALASSPPNEAKARGEQLRIDFLAQETAELESSRDRKRAAILGVGHGTRRNINKAG
jgi:hypothetical protein